MSMLIGARVVRMPLYAERRLTTMVSRLQKVRENLDEAVEDAANGHPDGARVSAGRALRGLDEVLGEK